MMVKFVSLTSAFVRDEVCTKQPFAVKFGLCTDVPLLRGGGDCTKASIGEKKLLVEIVLRQGNFREQKNPPPLPCPLHSKLDVCRFLQIARTSAQNCIEGMAQEKLYFLLLKSVKRKKAQFRVKCLHLYCRLLQVIKFAPSGYFYDTSPGQKLQICKHFEAKDHQYPQCCGSTERRRVQEIKRFSAKRICY